jgi:hypothetical protein
MLNKPVIALCAGLAALVAAPHIASAQSAPDLKSPQAETKTIGVPSNAKEEIVPSDACKQCRPPRRGTHAKGICARAQFEVLDVRMGRDPALAARLAQGIFAKPGLYPAVVRFANSDPNVNSNFKADVRAMSFFIEAPPRRLDYSMQNAPTLPLNDARAFLATIEVAAAASPPKVLWAIAPG